jgi:hypothetical protein
LFGSGSGARDAEARLGLAAEKPGLTAARDAFGIDLAGSSRSISAHDSHSLLKRGAHWGEFPMGMKLYWITLGATLLVLAVLLLNNVVRRGRDRHGQH